MEGEGREEMRNREGEEVEKGKNEEWWMGKREKKRIK